MNLFGKTNKKYHSFQQLELHLFKYKLQDPQKTIFLLRVACNSSVGCSSGTGPSPQFLPPTKVCIPPTTMLSPGRPESWSGVAFTLLLSFDGLCWRWKRLFWPYWRRKISPAYFLSTPFILNFKVSISSLVLGGAYLPVVILKLLHFLNVSLKISFHWCAQLVGFIFCSLWRKQHLLHPSTTLWSFP